jgi:hypothetical protein
MFQQTAFQQNAFQTWGNVTVAEVLAAQQSGGGKSKRRRKQAVEIDGETFVVSSSEEAIELLDRAKEQAEELAALAERRAANAPKRSVPKVVRDAKRTMLVPVISVDSEVRDYANAVMQQIQELYAATLMDIEIAARLRRIDHETDEEEVLILAAML